MTMCNSKHQMQKVARVVEQLCIITSVYTIVYQGMLKHAPMVIAEVNFHFCKKLQPKAMTS